MSSNLIEVSWKASEKPVSEELCNFLEDAFDLVILLATDRIWSQEHGNNGGKIQCFGSLEWEMVWSQELGKNISAGIEPREKLVKAVANEFPGVKFKFGFIDTNGPKWEKVINT